MSCTTSPVTQEAETAVKMASENGVHVLLLEEMGSIRRSVPTSIMAKKLNMIICEDERRSFFLFFIYSCIQAGGEKTFQDLFAPVILPVIKG